ncbi:MAG: AsmA-like C-terminal region-containing protein [Cyclobacteriaceae bacterium]
MSNRNSSNNYRKKYIFNDLPLTKKRKKKSFWRKLYHLILILAISSIALLSLAAVLVYKNQDKLVQLIIEEINKKIDTPVEVAKVELTLLDKFPQIAIKFSQVNMKESLPGNENPLAVLEKVYCTFGFWQLLAGNYSIDHFYLENGSLNLKKLSNGDINYQFLKSNQESHSGSKISLTFEHVDLRNVKFHYLDETNDTYLQANLYDLTSQLKITDQMYQIASNGDLTIKSLLIGQEEYANNRALQIKSNLLYNNENKHLQIQSSEINVLNTGYNIAGEVDIVNSKLNLEVSAPQTTIESLVSLLPERLGKEFRVYRSKGQISMQSIITGSYADDADPLVQFNFNCDNATFYHPEYNKSVKNVSLQGSFTNGEARDASTSHLILKNITGNFEGKSFSGALNVKDFNRYLVDLQLNADLEVNSLLQFYPVKAIHNASGRIITDIDFFGYLKDIETAKDLRNTRSTGEINLQELNFDLADFNLPFRKFDGNFIFKNDALAISNFSGNIGQSDFLLNGMFKNVMAYLFLKYQPILIEADLESNFINLNELLSGQEVVSVAENTSGYQLNISNKLDVEFNCKIDKLILKRFEGRAISGDLILKKQKVTSKNLKLATMGGHLTMNGYLDAKKPVIEAYTTTRLHNIHLDSAFYVFKNFNQDFLKSHHLKGQLFAEVKTYLEMDHELRMNSQSLISNIGMTIKNGELNNFEPMLKLSKYVDKDRLNHLRFSDLKNEILVHNRQVFLPKMAVGTNITLLEVNGTHTFDQKIDYRVKIPVKKFRAQETKFGPVEEDDSGNLNMFLKIEGTTEDYRIVYDTKAWKKNFDQNLKNEGQELKQIFKNKGKQEKKSKELNEEEVFEWN